MGNKRLSEVINYNEHIAPYRITEIISGVGSGKNYWVENVLMPQMRVLLITSRKAKVEETIAKIGVSKCLNLITREDNACDYFFSRDRKDGSCICSNGQIEYYMNNIYVSDNPRTYLWQFFDIVIVDEAHSLATDATYTNASFCVFDFIRGVYKQSILPIVLMTATHGPIDGLINIKNKNKYHYWDFTKECKNLLPKRLWYQTTEYTLQEMVKSYNSPLSNKSKWIYFATKTSTIANKIVPYLVNSGIPEKRIAVSFSGEEEKYDFSDVILKNKERVQEYLKTNEDLPEDIHFFITTSRNKEGININNPNYYWDVAIESHWTEEAAQMWGRVRNGLSASAEDKSPINKVAIIYDAPQHSKVDCNKDYSFILSNNCIDNVNASFDQWCKKNNLPLINRRNNNHTRKKIQDTVDLFPYLRYSYVNDKFCLYTGKVLGQKSFADSVDNFKVYVTEWLGEPIAQWSHPPFSIESFLIMPPKQIDNFEDYVIEKGFLAGKPLSPQAQKEMLDFVSNVLMVRQKSDVTKKYTQLSKAIKTFGYTLKTCSHHNDSPLYGYCELIKTSPDDLGEVF